MTATLRQASPGDIELLFDIRTSVKQNHLSREQLHAMGITAATLADAIDSSPCAWIAEWCREPAGFVMVDHEEGEVFALFVRPQHEGKGLGRLLLQRAEQELFQRHERIHLTTDGNEVIRANGFYRRLGWTCVEAVDDRDVRYEKRRIEAGVGMEIRLTTKQDWQRLKEVRLAALLDSPTAFGVSYLAAARYSDEHWQQRASSTGTAFWLAVLGEAPLGMVGAAVSDSGRFNLIGMWVEPAARGSGVAARLVEAVKARALERGHDRVFLDVAPENARAVGFYLRQGFVFLDEWEALESHPQIKVQTMVWIAG